jgi:hypothetical protein
VAGGWRRLHNEEFQNCTVLWLGNLKERAHLKELRVDGKIMLE